MEGKLEKFVFLCIIIFACTLSYLAVGAGKNPGVAAIHPNKKVPCLDDNGFTMFER